ncbi:CoA transferase [Niabella hibiscisoli]|uniref:CoA transferase n=1 Tax=Niabella hibiscisoli TaxID=1825928 RepID=UPI0021D4717D|nr:CoA transferase [Niabella hibiscisoli]
MPQRSAVNSGHAYVAAPYGIYQTKDDFIALAMADIIQLGILTGCDELAIYSEKADWFDKRDEIKSALARHLLNNTTSYWLDILEPAGIWCSRVLDYEQLTKEEGYQALNMEVVVKTTNGISIKTTRSPITIDTQYLSGSTGAPGLGEHNNEIDLKFEIGVKPEIIDAK